VVPVGYPERLDEVVELPDKEIDRPEVRAAIRIVRAAAVAELVVVDDRATLGEVGKREQVVVCRAGPPWRTMSGAGTAVSPGRSSPVTRYQVSASSPASGKATVPLRTSICATLRRCSGCPHLPRIPHPLARARRRVESGGTVVSATRTRRRERALSEAEAYARCHGHRPLCPVRVTVGPDTDAVQAALKRVLQELRP
jgi:hypothetical protein